jgi:hypothetical protein
MCALAGGSSSGTSPGDVHATKNEPEGKLRLGIENRELNGAGALTSPGYGPTLSKRRDVTSACDLDSIVMSGAWLKLERRAAIVSEDQEQLLCGGSGRRYGCPPTAH